MGNKQNWQHVKALRIIFLLQFLVITALLGLFGYTNPDTGPPELQADGAYYGFNSDPTTYTSTPYVWSTSLANFNFILSIVSLVVFIVQLTVHILDFYFPPIAIVFNLGFAAVWAYCVGSQAGPDYEDLNHISLSPWYLRMSCSLVTTHANLSYCNIARASFGLSVIMLAIILVILGFAIRAALEPTLRKRRQMHLMQDREMLREVVEECMAEKAQAARTSQMYPMTPSTAV
ncbi:hypothetical protein RUND412_002222 [Rhizina undulata]